MQIPERENSIRLWVKRAGRSQHSGENTDIVPNHRNSRVRYWARLSGKAKATDCRRRLRSEVGGGASATAISRTLMWFSYSEAQCNMAVLPLIRKVVLYNVKINMSPAPISHTHKLKIYSGKKKYVNPLELPGFLHKLVITFNLIFILVTIDKTQST